MPRTYNREYSRKHRHEHIAKYREQNWKMILNSAGLRFTSLDYDVAYQRQSGCCKICKRHSTLFRSRLAVDHDHLTKIFRGLLCLSCNTRLGLYENETFRTEAEIYLHGGK